MTPQAQNREIPRPTRHCRVLLRWAALGAAALCLAALPPLVHAETGIENADEAWLRYPALDAQTAKIYARLPPRVVLLGDSLVLKSAEQELMRGVAGMLGQTIEGEMSRGEMSRGEMSGKKMSRKKMSLLSANSIVLGTLEKVRPLEAGLSPPEELRADGFWLKSARIHGFVCLVVSGATERGVLYGVFALLRKISLAENIAALDEVEQPFAPIRWVNQWDNLDGSIERGYGGRSIFFADGKVRDDLTRVRQYGRLLASVGINGCTVNNVNAAARVLEPSFIAELSRIADAFRPWGVEVSLSVDLGSPKLIGGLDTFDPLDPRVAAWWRNRVDEIYRQIPDFDGFVVKADSEGRLGPSTYGRTHADAANVIARALKRHGGLIFYRAFVYNHHLDWRDLTNDRAKAAYDNFHPLDGAFDDNVIVQIKNGPIDFQVREPVSPLFAGLRRTNQAIELQITQEYTGQQRQLCFLVPMWKEVLDFDMHIERGETLVRDLVAGRVFHRPTGGLVGVSNVGLDANWLGSPLAMANLYGFGRLAWNPNLSAETIVDEWTRLSFGSDRAVVGTISALQLHSWSVYESYTGPLGAGTLTNILGNHYDPAPESSEGNGWGQWHRADPSGIGMDRTIATGTGFIGQYPAQVQKLYETLANCPDNLLLFFHHVPYTHVLHSGKTVIQHIYDSHFEGAEEAQNFLMRWRSLEGHLDESRYRDILARFEYQAQEAVIWRDTICRWIYELSHIRDAKGRVDETHR